MPKLLKTPLFCLPFFGGSQALCFADIALPKTFLIEQSETLPYTVFKSGDVIIARGDLAKDFAGAPDKNARLYVMGMWKWITSRALVKPPS